MISARDRPPSFGWRGWRASVLPGGERESELELSPNEIGRFVSGERSFGERWYVCEVRVSFGS